MRYVLFLLISFLNLSMTAGQAQQQQVIIFGVDGLNVYRFNEAETPNFDIMRQEGSWTYQAQANEPLSSSPNWKSIISGSTPDVHKVMENGFDPDVYRKDPGCVGENDIMPTIFTLIKRHDSKAKTGYFQHWSAFRRLVKGENINKHFWWEFGPKPNVKRAITFYQRKVPALTFIHVDQCDHAGHKYGHESPEYLEAVEQTDELLGRVIAAIRKKDNFKNTTLIVVSDHGGKGTSHGPGTVEGMTIPWLIMGPGIKKGHEIQMPVKNEDTALMVMRALGIPPHPCWTAKVIEELYE